MGIRKVNVLSCRVEDESVPDSFRHREMVIGPAIGGERIGASVYEAYAGVPIWPYHYHYGVEEWLYVLSGIPVLRDAGGRRELHPGDVVCFPAGHLGAHTVEGPGRFIIFSSDERPTHLCVYPDSDKMAVAPGSAAGEGIDFMIVPRDAGVDYWRGESDDAPAEEVQMVRQPDSGPSRPVVASPDVEGELDARLESSLLGGTIMALRDGDAPDPYHYVYGREEWALVLDGQLTVRHPEGHEDLSAGDVTCFPEGPSGARQLATQGTEARVMLLHTTGLPANFCYPDTGRWLIRNSPEEELLLDPDQAG